ncbi:retrovirus-related pol polyprotein from transposon TNT 1-94, partial [Tanacetum coccineum]
VSVPEMFHEQTDDELTKAEIKQMEADDQEIHTILLGLPEDIYAVYNQKEVDELRAERLAKAQDPLALMANSNNPFNYPVFHPNLPSSSTFTQQPPTNNNYNSQPSFNQNYMQQPMPNPKDITDPTVVQNAVQNPGVQNVGNQNGVIVVSGIANQNGNGNVVAARAEGNANRNNGNQIRCYNCRGLGHPARNCTVKPRRRDGAYL